MHEYISRDAAIEETRNPRLTDAELRRRLALIPAADVVERKKGKWKLHHDGSATCSECGFVQPCAWDMDSWDNFCHHCGADMRDGGQDK